MMVCDGGSVLVVKVNVISVAKLMENILTNDPGIVSLQLDGWLRRGSL